MRLVDQIKLKLSDFHREKVNLIDDFDYSNVVKKVQEEFGVTLTDRYLEEGINNLKRYYVVALLDPTNRHAVSAYVDPFWHVHVLFTREYADFCESIYGQFVHHTPLIREDKKMVSHVRDLYNYTVDVYEDIFYEVDKNWWPVLAKDKEICYHMEIYAEDIRARALFSEKAELKYQIA